MFYLLGQPTPDHPCRWIEDEPYVEGVNFQLGRKPTVPVPQPLTFTLEPLDELARDHGPSMPPVFKESILLFRDDFIQAMASFGVDNIDMYEATIYDPDNGETYTNYKAVNIIGVVSAADMQQSEATVHDGVPLIDVDFDGLVIDESKAGNYLLFRLAEKTTAILMRDDLKDYLVKQGFDDVTFDDPSTSAV